MKKGHEGPAGVLAGPPPGCASSVQPGQDERIEAALANFVEAFLAGAASVEVTPINTGGWSVRLRA